jgi:hypothetical protein
MLNICVDKPVASDCRRGKKVGEVCPVVTV